MLYRIFKSNHPSVILFIFLISGLLWLHMFMHFHEATSLPYSRFEMPLYYGIEQLLLNSPLLSLIVTIMVLLLDAFMLNRINASYILLTKTTFMPALFFILIVSAYIPLQQLTPLLFSALFFILGLHTLFRTYRQEGQWMRIFDSSVLIAIGSLFYIKLGFFLFIVWMGILVLRKPSGREWLISIIGFAVPYVMVGVYLFVFQGNLMYQLQLYLIQLWSFEPLSVPDFSYLFFFGFLLILVLIASLKFMAEFQTRKVKIRRYYIMFFWVFATSVVLLLIHRISYEGLVVFTAIPVSYLLSNYYLSLRSPAWGNLSLFILLLLTVFIQLRHYGLIPDL